MAKLSYLANSLMENRHDLVAGVDVRHASGTGERDGALDLLIAAGAMQGATLGADKGYDAQDFIAALRAREIGPLTLANEETLHEPKFEGFRKGSSRS